MHATGVGFVYASWFIRGKTVSELAICVNVLALGRVAAGFSPGKSLGR